MKGRRYDSVRGGLYGSRREKRNFFNNRVSLSEPVQVKAPVGYNRLFTSDNVLHVETRGEGLPLSRVYFPEKGVQFTKLEE